MEIKVEDSKVKAVTLVGGIYIPLENVYLGDIAELEEHITWIEEHSPNAHRKTPKWNQSEIGDMIQHSSELQKKFLKKVFRTSGAKDSLWLINEIGVEKTQALAGIQAGFTRRIRRDYGGKEDLIIGKWNTDASRMTYKPNPEYYEMVKNILNP